MKILTALLSTLLLALGLAGPAVAGGLDGEPTTYIDRADGIVSYNPGSTILKATMQNPGHCIRARLFAYDGSTHSREVIAKVTDCTQGDGGEFRFADAPYQAWLQLCRSNGQYADPYDCTDQVSVKHD